MAEIEFDKLRDWNITVTILYPKNDKVPSAMRTPQCDCTVRVWGRSVTDAIDAATKLFARDVCVVAVKPIYE